MKTYNILYISDPYLATLCHIITTNFNKIVFLKVMHLWVNTQMLTLGLNIQNQTNVQQQWEAEASGQFILSDGFTFFVRRVI